MNNTPEQVAEDLIEKVFCERCEKDTDEVFMCERCEMMICDKCQETYNQFSQIDFICCKSCTETNPCD